MQKLTSREKIISGSLRVSKVTLKWTGPVKILSKGQLESNLIVIVTFRSKDTDCVSGILRSLYRGLTTLKMHASGFKTEHFIDEALQITTRCIQVDHEGDNWCSIPFFLKATFGQSPKESSCFFKMTSLTIKLFVRI